MPPTAPASSGPTAFAATGTTPWVTPTMLGVVLLLASTPLWLSQVGLYPYIAVEITIWMLFALAHNLLLGHGAFFGIGAYAFGLLQQRAGAGLLMGLFGAIVVAALCGALVAAFISHKRGIYYALLTIAFGQVAWFIAGKWHSVTGGEDGLLNIRRPDLDLGFATLALRSNESFFYFVLAVFALMLVLLWRLVHSPFGRVLRAIKQNEMRAAFVGHRVWLTKWLAFVISTAVSGLAGALFAMAQQSAYPNVMSLHNSGYVVMMVLIGGGMVSFWGPVIGATVFILVRDLLGAFTEAWLLWYGLFFIAVVLFQPEGIAGLGRDLWRRVRPARPVRDDAAGAPAQGVRNGAV